MLRRFAAPVRATVAHSVLPQRRTFLLPRIMVSESLDKRARQALQHAPQKDRFFLIDNSAAMKGYRIRQVQNALETARDKKMRDKDRVAVVTFGARGVAWAVRPQYVKNPVSRSMFTINGDLVSLDSDLLQTHIETHRPLPALLDAFDLALTQYIRPNTDFIVVASHSQTADEPKAAAIRKRLSDQKIKLHIIHIDQLIYIEDTKEEGGWCEAYRQLCSNNVGHYWRIVESDIRNAIGYL